MIVEVEIIEPRSHIFSSGTDAADLLGEKFQRLHIAIRAALVVIRAPLLNFPSRALVRRVFRDPEQDFAVAFSLRQLGFERFRGQAGEAKPMVIDRVVIFVFARGPGEIGPAFFEDTGEGDIAAATDAWAAGRTVGEVGRGI